MMHNVSRTPAHRGLLLGFARQPCGKESVGGPVVGVDGVSRSAFVFIAYSIYLFRRLLTTSSQVTKSLFHPFDDLRLSHLLAALFR